VYVCVCVDRTQVLMSSRQILYHFAVSPAQDYILHAQKLFL
jgi:hypothetical protein